MAFLEEFKKFAVRGNVADMAVGVIIGAAFGPVVKSIVDDLMMPPIGMLVGNADFKDLYLILRQPVKDGLVARLGTDTTLAAAREKGAVVLAYGSVFNTILNFVIVAFAVFLLVKGMNRLAAKETPPPPPNSRDCPFCCSSIPLAARRCPHCTSDLAKA